MPDPGHRSGTLLGRILRFVRGGGGTASRPAPGLAAPPERWPHLARGWLDPDMPLTAWKTVVDSSDVEDVLRMAAALSEGRVGDAEVAEVLDALAHTGADGARAFRFGKARSFAQLWIGAAPASASGVKLFFLGSSAFVEALDRGLSLASFAPAAKRSEYEELRRFFLAAWSWQWSSAPFAAELHGSKPKDFDPARTAESMERVLSNPRTPLLELLRGLRRRTRDLLDDTGDLSQPDVEAADAYLASRGAATLSEIRRRYRERPADPS